MGNYRKSRYLCWEVNRANRAIPCTAHKFPPHSLLILRMGSTELNADSHAMLLNYFRRKDAKDKAISYLNLEVNCPKK